MADESVETFLKGKKKGKAAAAASDDKNSAAEKLPLLQMKKYVCPKVKSASGESTEVNDSQDGVHASKK